MNDEQSLFLADAIDMVEKLDRDLEHLRASRAEGRRRRELVAQIFRRVHTLKGSAGSLGFKSVARIAHELESVIDGARLGRVKLNDAVLDMFADALETIAGALRIEQVDQGFDEVIDSLHGLDAASKPKAVIAKNLRSSLPEDIARALSEYDLEHAREAVREGARLFIVTATFAIDTFDQKFRDLTKLLGQSGEVIATVPGEPPTADGISFRLFYASELMSGELLRQASLLGRVSHTEIEIDRESIGAPPFPSFGPGATTAHTKTSDSLARVELKKVDELISATNELYRHTAKALAALTNESNSKFVATTSRDLRGQFARLEERLMKLRLVPARTVLERAAARAGRIAARQLGKEVEFKIVGGDVGIEKSLAETISDPLFHLVRNAITHGIETPGARKRAGKDPLGHVTLTASNHSGRIHITVTDDGRGINPDEIIAAAAERGISSSGLSMDQCLRLIFRPGFSTARDLSDLSGRGIGLDVVDRTMEAAGGEVRVATEQGVGTKFAMIVPAALSMVRCLMVRCGDQIYAIDSAYASDSMPNSVDEQQTFVSLQTLLGQSDRNDVTQATTIFWKAPQRMLTKPNGVQSYRIAVDAILGRHETLVRSLGRHAPRWAGVCGAAEMFDGNVALVLDLDELISEFRDRNQQSP